MSFLRALSDRIAKARTGSENGDGSDGGSSGSGGPSPAADVNGGGDGGADPNAARVVSPRLTINTTNTFTEPDLVTPREDTTPRGELTMGRLRERFGRFLDEDEYVIASFRCSMVMDQTHAGELAVTNDHICFVTPREAYLRVIALSEVDKIDSQVATDPPTLNVVLSDGTDYYFAGFVDPEGARNLMRDVLIQNRTTGSSTPREDATALRNEMEEADRLFAERLAAGMATPVAAAGNDDEALARAIQEEMNRNHHGPPTTTPYNPHYGGTTGGYSTGGGVPLGSGGWPKTMTCVSSVVADQPDLEQGDKIILPPGVLAELAQNEAYEYPYAFRLTNPVTGAATHVGVLSFLADPRTAVLPYWIMRNLGLDEGSVADLEIVTLPQGTMVQLQPLLADWVDVDHEVRMAILEDQLANFQSLTVGDVIPISYGGRSFDMRVTQAQPADSISIVNTNLMTDVIEPVEPVKQIEGLKEGEAVDGHLEPGEYSNFLFYVGEATDFWIEVTAEGDGDPDLYVSNAIKRPSRTHYTWCANRQGANTLAISAADPDFGVGSYYIGVHAYNTPTDFVLTVGLGAAPSSSGQTLGDGGSGGEASTSGGGAAPDTQLCPHCRKHIRAAIFVMHEVQCARRTFVCPECNESMPLTEKDKHLEIRHTTLFCECGDEFSQEDLQAHKRDDCPLRVVICNFCPLALPAAQMREHQETCGARTCRCSQAGCGERVQRRRLLNHLAAFHAIMPGTLTDDEVKEMMTAQTPVGGYAPDFGATATATVYACPRCTRTFTSIQDRGAHLLIDHYGEVGADDL